MTARLIDVARRAGVSEATASRVLNGRRYVSPGSRQRVVAAARALDYIPNRAARDLSLARTATIGFLAHHSQYPAGGEGTFATRVLLGATRALHARGYDLLYAVVDDDAVGRLASLPTARAGRADGVMLLGPAFPEEAIAALHATGIPTVLVDNCLPSATVDAVLADNDALSAALTHHLLGAHRYRRVVCLAGPPAWRSTAERVAGYRRAMHGAGQEPFIRHAPETTVRHGQQLAAELLDDVPEAAVAINDAMAIGALFAWRSLGAARPAVVGFDDIAWARLADPPLTTVAVDAEAMGALAANRLVARIEGDDVAGEPGVVRMAGSLVIRRSCGCAAVRAKPRHDPEHDSEHVSQQIAGGE